MGRKQSRAEEKNQAIASLAKCGEVFLSLRNVKGSCISSWGLFLGEEKRQWEAKLNFFFLIKQDSDGIEMVCESLFI